MFLTLHALALISIFDNVNCDIGPIKLRPGVYLKHKNLNGDSKLFVPKPRQHQEDAPEAIILPKRETIAFLQKFADNKRFRTNDFQEVNDYADLYDLFENFYDLSRHGDLKSLRYGNNEINLENLIKSKSNNGLLDLRGDESDFASLLDVKNKRFIDKTVLDDYRPLREKGNYYKSNIDTIDGAKILVEDHIFDNEGMLKLETDKFKLLEKQSNDRVPKLVKNKQNGMKNFLRYEDELPILKLVDTFAKLEETNKMKENHRYIRLPKRLDLPSTLKLSELVTSLGESRRGEEDISGSEEDSEENEKTGRRLIKLMNTVDKRGAEEDNAKREEKSDTERDEEENTGRRMIISKKEARELGKIMRLGSKSK